MNKRLQIFGAILSLIFTLLLNSSCQGVDVVVAKDGSGDFTSIQAAINAAPEHGKERYVILLKEGKYDEEKLIIPETKCNITLRGEGKGKTCISYHMHDGNSPETGNKLPVEAWNKWKDTPMLVRTSATLTIMGEGCRVEDLTLQNTAGPVGQALAVVVCADKTMFVRCNLLSYQDTVFLWTHGKRSYFKDCLVLGHTDYIYGGGIGYFESCELRTWGGGYVTAPSTPQEQSYGFVFNDCDFTYATNSPREGDDGQPIAIGRPWHNYPKVAILNSSYCDEINPEGWPTVWFMEYAATSPDLHLYEYNNTGKRADMSQRAKWAGIKELTKEEAQLYTVDKVLGDMSNW
ncbi:MAG: hypothetical protein IJ456_05285 [Bacteroides sp.]|nr:hypothetical protein [Bacteroides sp.]